MSVCSTKPGPKGIVSGSVVKTLAEPAEVV
jgi:hypothetical protein